MAMTPAPEDYVVEEGTGIDVTLQPEERHASVRKLSDSPDHFFTFATLADAQRYACEWAAVERVRAWTRLPNGDLELIDCHNMLHRTARGRPCDDPIRRT